MKHMAGWNLRRGGNGIKVQLLSAFACLVLLSGCVSESNSHPASVSPTASANRGPVDIYQLAKTEDEAAFLQILQSENPQWATDEGKLRLALRYHRHLNLRTQALAIQFRHQYPSATEEEIRILTRDAVSREANERQDATTRALLSAPPAPSGASPVHCFSDKVFGTIYTDCY